jgi:serine/threonine protein kinase
VDRAAAVAGWAPPLPDELAALLPAFEILRILGRGGMGAVYLGRDRKLDRLVAIKLLPPELSAEASYVDRFMREAKALARLDHHNIIHIHAFDQTAAGHLYFVMEYVDGVDLHRLMRPAAPSGSSGSGLLPYPTTLEIISRICDALQYAHDKGIIHRDIKPANVIVATDGRVKVADFGLARAAEVDPGAGSMTQTGTIMGTPDYMAPEQRDGHPADHRADIYALGVMFYEMLTGSIPRGAFPPPSRRVRVDVRLDEVVLKALQSEPDLRYQQASEVKTDVTRIQTTPPQFPPGNQADPSVPVGPEFAVPARGNRGRHAENVTSIPTPLYVQAPAPPHPEGERPRPPLTKPPPERNSPVVTPRSKWRLWHATVSGGRQTRRPAPLGVVLILLAAAILFALLANRILH